MIVYAESSAVLAWLFREPDGSRVESILADTDYVFTSDLTLIECARAIHRAVALGRLADATGRRIASALASVSVAWEILHLLPQVIERAGQPFPDEPIRSLDALHVASALYAKSQHASLQLLSLDQRIRKVGNTLELSLLPD